MLQNRTKIALRDKEITSHATLEQQSKDGGKLGNKNGQNSPADTENYDGVICSSIQEVVAGIGFSTTTQSSALYSVDILKQKLKKKSLEASKQHNKVALTAFLPQTSSQHISLNSMHNSLPDEISKTSINSNAFNDIQPNVILQESTTYSDSTIFHKHSKSIESAASSQIIVTASSEAYSFLTHEILNEENLCTNELPDQWSFATKTTVENIQSVPVSEELTKLDVLSENRSAENLLQKAQQQLVSSENICFEENDTVTNDSSLSSLETSVTGNAVETEENKDYGKEINLRKDKQKIFESDKKQFNETKQGLEHHEMAIFETIDIDASQQNNEIFERMVQQGREDKITEIDNAFNIRDNELETSATALMVEVSLFFMRRLFNENYIHRFSNRHQKSIFLIIGIFATYVMFHHHWHKWDWNIN